MHLSHWKNTNTIVNWSIGLVLSRKKHPSSFLVVDIKSFNSLKINKKGLRISEAHINISDEAKHKINHSKKYLLYNNQQG